MPPVQSPLQNMQNSLFVPTLAEGLTGIKRELVVLLVQEPLVLNAQDFARASRFFSADTRQSCSADCFTREVDAVVRNRQGRIAIACFTIGDNELVDDPLEFFADSVHGASHFVFVVRMSNHEQHTNRPCVFHS